jgi:site-specific DNA recombinase
MTDHQYEKYRGLRALLLTRVSTSRQVEMYGHVWQEMQIRKLLIEPFGLLLDENRHIIHDTYTGLEYRYREALDQILTMAANGEFDVLCMEVLDRGLGRKGLPREMFRMQLRELGIRILTTDPDEHSDDDSLVGEMIRLIKGYKAEEEINDLVRRTMGGKRAKASGIEKDGTPGQRKIIGNGSRLYGFKFVLDEHGKPFTIEPNHDVFLDANGQEWTEVKVVLFVFESSKAGVSVRRIAEILNEKQIPPPSIAKGVKVQGKKGPVVWQPSVILKILRQSAYWGEYRQFHTLTGEKKPGRKTKPRVPAPETDQIIIPVPAIVSKELAETVHHLLPIRQNKASRNNKTPHKSLLRAGFVQCGECGANMTASRRLDRSDDHIFYYCGRRNLVLRCPGASIVAHVVDDAAWQRAIKIIRDPSEVDEKLQQLTASNKLAEQQKQTVSRLAGIRAKQKKLRKNLSELMQAEKLDKGTEEFLSGELFLLAQQEEQARKELANEQALQDKYTQLQDRIAAFHQRCLEWREKLDDAEFILDYDFKRDAVEFFGIHAIVYRYNGGQQFDIEVRPPSIVSLTS